MKGINIAEDCHVVNLLPPHDANTVATPEVFSMEGYSHVTIIVQAGVTGATTTFTVEGCSDFSATASTAIAFNYYAEQTANGDTLSAKTAATTSGFATGTNDNIMFVIEVDAAELLTTGYNKMRLVASDPGATTYLSAVAILSGARHSDVGGSVTAIV